MSKPTIEQQKVIDATFQKIKVSANAGSGKTFTIMQRIAQIIKNGSSRLDQLLVLTLEVNKHIYIAYDNTHIV